MGTFDKLRDLLGTVLDVRDRLLPPRCPIPWRPSPLAPVFYGFHDVGPPVIGLSVATATTRAEPEDLHTGILAPVPMRILFPTLDGSPQHAAILHPCGRYPLVVLLHGECVADQRGHYLAWARSPLAMQLARAGYVVVVPQLSGRVADDEQVTLVRSVIRWVRTRWIHATLLADPPVTALVGHSRGSVLAGLAAAQEGVQAYVSLSGDWHGKFGDPTEAQKQIAAPMIFVKGTDEADVDLGRFSELPLPRYRAVLEGAGHFDYLLPGSSPCVSGTGGCGSTPAVAADLVTMFLGRFAPPPAVASVSDQIPTTLVRTLGQLTLQQEFFAGAYLTGFPSLAAEGCGLVLTFQVPGGQQGQVTF